MTQPIERLRNDVLAGAAALGGNPVAIGNHFTNIIEGLQTIIGSYEQVIPDYRDCRAFSLFYRSIVFVHKSDLK